MTNNCLDRAGGATPRGAAGGAPGPVGEAETARDRVGHSLYGGFVGGTEAAGQASRASAGLGTFSDLSGLWALGWSLVVRYLG